MNARDEIRVLLVRQPDAGLVAQRGFVVVEPLALEMLAQVCTDQGADWLLWDSVVADESLVEALTRYRPHVVAMSVVITTIWAARECAGLAKSLVPDVVVCVGGPEPEVNPSFFFHDCFDVVVHSGGVAVLGDLLSVLRHGTRKAMSAVAGVWWRSPEWVRNPDRALDLSRQGFPNREHFRKYREQFHYLGDAGCALVKGSYGCPYRCDFCFCREMNQGLFQQRPVSEIVAEIAGLSTDLVWLVDDVFAVTGERLREFEAEIVRQNVSKRFMVYLRSDLVADPDLASTLASLASKGLFMVLVGLESFSEVDLDSMRKGISARAHGECIRALKSAGIVPVGLFFIPLRMGFSGFFRFARDLWRSGLPLCTVGVETPFPGTASFDRFRQRLVTQDLRRWDLLHVVVRPDRMPRSLFQICFGGIQVLAAAICLRSGELRWRFVKRLLHPGKRVRNASREGSRFRDWNFWAGRYERLWVQRFSLAPTRRKMREILRRLVPGTLRLIDVGCGTGQLLRELQQERASGDAGCETRLRGIDSSAGMIDQALLMSAGIEFRGCKAEDLSGDPGTWNAVTCAHALPHCDDPQWVLERIARLLTPDGVFVLAQATRDRWYDRLVLFFVGLTVPKTSAYVSSAELQLWLAKEFCVLESGRVREHGLVSTISYFVCRPRKGDPETNE